MRKRNYLLIISLLANLGLAYSVASLLGTRHETPVAPVQSSSAPQTVTLTNERIAGFHWAQLESEDYRIYIANLRAVSCPEETIRDIILAEIDKLYRAKHTALIAQEGQNYWEWDRPGTVHNNDRQRELFQEKIALVRELLGIDLQADNQNAEAGLKASQQRLGFLPEPKRQQLSALEAKYSELERQVYANSHGLSTSEDQAAIAALQQQKSAAMSALLMPQELTEYGLRNSSAAQELRRQLSAFTPTEAEFRTIYQAKVGLQEKLNSPGSGPDNNNVPTSAAADPEQEFANQLKSALGAQRYAEYQRSIDPDYQNLLRIADRYGLPSEVASQVFGLKQNVELQKHQLLEDPQLDTQQKQTALQALRQQASVAAASMLGETGFNVYRDRGGFWLSR